MNLNRDNSEKVTYSYDGYPIYVRRALLSEYPEYMALAHWHNDFELTYSVSGEMEYTVNGKTVLLSEGNGIFVNSRRMHFGFSTSKKECDFICIRFLPLLLCASEAYERDFVLPIINRPENDLIFLERKIEWQNEALDIILEINKIRNDKTAPLKIQSLLLKLWALICDNIEPCTPKTFPNPDFSLLREMLGYIQNNYMKKISLKNLSQSASVSEGKCCKLFSKYIGMTPNCYLLNYRLQKGRELLVNSSASVTEIALATGFCGGSYFTQIFRKQYGVTPTEYRKKSQVKYSVET